MIQHRRVVITSAFVGLALILAAAVLAPRADKKATAAKPEPSPAAEAATAAAIDQEHRLQVALEAPALPDAALGQLSLGSIHLLRINVGPKATVRSVAGSCSCLQVLGLPTGDSGEQEVIVRYLAVRAGVMDVALAFSRLDAAGQEQIKMLRLTGNVGPGDQARATAFEALLKSPLLLPLSKDLSGLVDAKTALESVRAGRGVLVDVRPQERFAPHHAVPAIQVPPAQLSMNGFFASREVYLTGEALVTDELLQARRRLMRQPAAKVSIVDGGVLAWQAAGGQVFQELDEKLMASRVEPAELFAGLGNPRVHMLAWNVPDETAARFFLPGLEISSAADWSRRAGEILRQDPRASVVLIDGHAPARFDTSAVAPDWLGRVSWLSGGFESYRAHVAELSTIAATKPGTAKGSVKPLANTGPFQGLTLKRGGCGTCPK